MISIPMTIIYNKNKPEVVIKLKKGDEITVRLADDFRAGASIDEVTVYNNIVRGGRDRPSKKALGTWQRRRGGGVGLLGTFYSVESLSANEVKITDIEDEPESDKHWLGFAGKAKGKPWSVDPELINRPGG